MILLYHNLVPLSAPVGYRYASLTLQSEIFNQHIHWLALNFHLVSIEEYLNLSPGRSRWGKKTIAITFDDGTATSFACAFPILQRWKVPATFFVTTCHLENGELLWGSYLNAVCFENIYSNIIGNGKTLPLQTPLERKRSRQAVGEMALASGNPILFTRNLAQAHPLPPDIQSVYQGMTLEQLQIAGQSDLIEIGAHTVTHQNLSSLPIDLQAQEIIDSKQILTDLTGRQIRYFAYPSGDYTFETIGQVKNAGYVAAFATLPRALGDDPCFEIERVGVYSPSLFKLHFKAIGLAKLVRRMGLPIG